MKLRSESNKPYWDLHRKMFFYQDFLILRVIGWRKEKPNQNFGMLSSCVKSSRTFAKHSSDFIPYSQQLEEDGQLKTWLVSHWLWTFFFSSFIDTNETLKYVSKYAWSRLTCPPAAGTALYFPIDLYQPEYSWKLEKRATGMFQHTSL